MLRSLPPEVAGLLATQHGVASTAQLQAVGLTARQCRLAVQRGLLRRPYRGVYLDSAAWSAASDPVRHAMQLLGAQLVAPDAVGIDVTATIAWQLPVRAIPNRVAVARDGSAGRLVCAKVRRAPVAAVDTAMVDGLLVTTLPVTCAAIAATRPLADALITLDAALRRGVRADELVAAAEGLPFATHRERAQRAIDLADPWSESWLESLSRGRGIEAGLPVPLCNVTLIAGSREARVDELWAELGVVGEPDGEGKYRKRDDIAKAHWDEKRRHEWLEDLGFGVARWGTVDVASDADVMVARLARATRRRAQLGAGWPSGVTAELRALPGVAMPARVAAEVARLQALGIPIEFAPPDYWRQRERLGSLWTPASARRPTA